MQWNSQQSEEESAEQDKRKLMLFYLFGKFSITDGDAST